MGILHPGDLLLEEMLHRDVNLSTFARQLDLPADYLSDLLRAGTPLTPEAAQNIATALGTSLEFWLNAQAAFENDD